MQIEHTVELRGFVYRALVQTLVLMQRKKDWIWHSLQHAGLKVIWPSLRKRFQHDKFMQIICIVNVWLKVFWVFMYTCLSVSGDLYNFEKG